MNENRQPTGYAPKVLPDRVLVVFSGTTDIPWLRALKPGFRHCFALVESRGQWLMYDPSSHETRIERIGPMPLAELLRWLDVPDTTVICCRRSFAPAKLAPIRPYTCVEATKRLLGIQAPWTLTPWQLFRFLVNENKKKSLFHDFFLDFFKIM